ncbi:MAG: hypothetical protein ACE363_12760 [Alphaproteobacteria bacterium]
MAQYEVAHAPRSLADAVSRDLVITAISVALGIGLVTWHGATGSTFSLIISWVVGFVLSFFFVYLTHEWGHYLGARLAGADIPLGPASGIFLGLFDTKAHSRKQFMWMAMGGEVGYLLPAAILIGVFWNWSPLEGVAVGALGFIIQALWVDVPILWRIHKGADIDATLSNGLAPKIILSKTLIGWAAMGVGIAGWGALA